MAESWIKKEKPEDESEESTANVLPAILPLEWLDEFPWLAHVSGSDVAVCGLCQSVGHPGVLPSVSYHEILAHAWSVVHKEAEIRQSQRTIEEETRGATSNTSLMDMAEEHEEDRPNLSVSHEPSEPAKPSADKRRRRFCRHWLATFPWLKYDSENNLMFCKYCIKHRTGNSSFVRGNSSFKMTTIQAHAHCKEHYLAERAESLSRPQKGEEIGTGVIEHKLTRQKSYMLKKFLHFFPWLLYNSDMNVVICDVCQRHTVNTLYVECTTELDYDVIRAHCDSRKHQQAEEAEVKTWVSIFEEADAKGIPLNDDPPKLINLPETIAENGHIEQDKFNSSTFTTQEVSVVPMDNESSRRRPSEVEEEEEEEEDRSFASSPVDAIHPFLEEQANLVSYPEGLSGKRYKSKKGHILPAFGVFKAQWMQEFPWLSYESERNLMRCMLCAKYSKNTTFSRGVRVFSRSYIIHHTKIAKHKDAARQEIIIVPGGGLVGPAWQDNDMCSGTGKGRKKTQDAANENKGSDGQGKGGSKRKETEITQSTPVSHKKAHPTMRTMRYMLSPERQANQLTPQRNREMSGMAWSPASSPGSPISGAHSSRTQPEEWSPNVPSKVMASSQPSDPVCGGDPKEPTPKFYQERGFSSSGSSDDAGSGDTAQEADAKNNPQEMADDNETVSGKGYIKVRRFCSHWLVIFPWLLYDENEKIMLCKLCCRYNLNNTFTRGSRSFHIDTLRKHEGSIVHQSAAKHRAGMEVQGGNFTYSSPGPTESMVTPVPVSPTQDVKPSVSGGVITEPVYPTSSGYPVPEPYSQRFQEHTRYLDDLSDVTYRHQEVSGTDPGHDCGNPLPVIKQEKVDYD